MRPLQPGAAAWLLGTLGAHTPLPSSSQPEASWCTSLNAQMHSAREPASHGLGHLPGCPQTSRWDSASGHSSQQGARWEMATHWGHPARGLPTRDLFTATVLTSCPATPQSCPKCPGSDHGLGWPVLPCRHHSWTCALPSHSTHLIRFVELRPGKRGKEHPRQSPETGCSSRLRPSRAV